MLCETKDFYFKSFKAIKLNILNHHRLETVFANNTSSREERRGEKSGAGGIILQTGPRSWLIIRRDAVLCLVDIERMLTPALYLSHHLSLFDSLAWSAPLYHTAFFPHWAASHVTTQKGFAPSSTLRDAG